MNDSYRVVTAVALPYQSPQFFEGGMEFSAVGVNGGAINFEPPIIIPMDFRLTMHQNPSGGALIAGIERIRPEVDAATPRDALWQKYRIQPKISYGHITRDDFGLLVDELEAKHATELAAVTTDSAGREKAAYQKGWDDQRRRVGFFETRTKTAEAALTTANLRINELERAQFVTKGGK